MESGHSEFLSGEDAVNLLIQQYSEYKDLERGNLRGRVTRVLSDLEKQGYVQRQKLSNLFRSELTVSDEQREAIVSLVTLIDNFKNGDRQTIEEGRIFAQRVLNDTELFSQLMLKAKEASPYANRTNREDMDAWLLGILYRQPNTTNRQIQQILDENYGKKLLWDGINFHLLRLVKEGKIISQNTKSGNVYRVVEPDVQADLPQN